MFSSDRPLMEKTQWWYQWFFHSYRSGKEAFLSRHRLISHHQPYGCNAVDNDAPGYYEWVEGTGTSRFSTSRGTFLKVPITNHIELHDPNLTKSAEMRPDKV